MFAYFGLIHHSCLCEKVSDETLVYLHFLLLLGRQVNPEGLNLLEVEETVMIFIEFLKELRNDVSLRFEIKNGSV
jgi:hypothetical protein